MQALRIMIVSACVVASVGAENPPTSVDHLAGESLEAGLPKIAPTFGVRMRSGTNSKDRRLFLFPLDRPLDNFKPSLAAFVAEKPGKARWFRDAEVHVFDEDTASRAARELAGRRERNARIQRRRRAWEQAQSWAKPGAQDSEPLSSGKQQFRSYLNILAGLPAGERNAAFGGTGVRVPFDRLSPSAQASVYELVKDTTKGSEADPASTFVGARDYGRAVVEALPTGSPDKPGIRVRIQLGPTGGVGMRDVLNPPLWDPSRGWDRTHHLKGYRARSRHPEGMEKLPSLQKQISIRGGSRATIEQVLSDLSDEGELPILGDYDPCYMNPYNPAENGQTTLEPGSISNVPVWKALDLICVRFDLDWKYSNGWILIRSPRTVLAWGGELDLSPPKSKDRGAAP